MAGLLHVDELAFMLLDDRLDQRPERFRNVPIDWVALLPFLELVCALVCALAALVPLRPDRSDSAIPAPRRQRLADFSSDP